MLIEELSKYGNIKHQYLGKGRFRNSSSDCDFGIVQLSDSSIYMSCEFKSISDGVKLDLNKGDTPTFMGKTEDEKQLVLDGELIEISGNYPTNRSIFIPTGESYLRIGNQDVKSDVEFRFNITNFTFIGTQSEQLSENRSQLNAIKTQLGEYVAIIRKVQDFKMVEAKLDSRKGTEITCQVIFETRKISEIKYILQAAGDLCSLLTIANGTLISWISFEIYSSDKERIYIQHQQTRTMDYSPIKLIDEMPPRAIESFINVTYQKYSELNEIYDLSTIARLFASLHIAVFIEIRALGLSSLVEYLLNKFAKHQSIKESRNLQVKLQKFIEHFCIPISHQEITDFKNSRNSLAHGLRFNTDDGAKEYQTMVYFFDRLLLGMLKYRGYYINSTKIPHIVGDETDFFEPTC